MNPFVSNYQLVRDWMITFKREVDKDFNSEDVSLCYELIDEEFYEVGAELAFEDKFKLDINKEALTKELCDAIWVCYFTAAKFGLPIEAAFERVYESNMSKLDDNGQPLLREDGKILKSNNYKPADLKDLF